jgi:type VI secretion system secreted protein Hcp
MLRPLPSGESPLEAEQQQETVMAFDAFVKIEGIPGESTDDKHKEWIEVLSFEHAIDQPAGADVSRHGGMSGARANIAPFVLRKVIDKATPNLNGFSVSGAHIPKIELEICAAAGDKHTFMKYTLTDAIITGVKMTSGDSREGTRPVEEVSFRFAKIEWEYTPEDDQRFQSAPKNLETNKKV